MMEGRWTKTMATTCSAAGALLLCCHGNRYCGGAPAIFSDAGGRTWIFPGRIVCARKQVFYGRTELDFMLPVVLLCYPKVP